MRHCRLSLLITTAQTDLAAIQGTLDADKSASATSEQNASSSATKSQEYAVNPYSTVVSGTTDYSSLHHATDSNDSKVIAVQAKDDAEILKGDVETLKSETTDIYDDAYDLATYDEDVEISSGVYSLKHYTIKAQAAAAAAQSAVASVTNALYFVGAWDASGNTAPPAPAIVNGSPQGSPMYKVSVSGVIDSVDYEPNDSIVFDNANSTHDGTNWTLEKWFKIDNTENVVSVNGSQGVVVIGIADIAGLQSALDNATNTANSKVSQTSYDTDKSNMEGRIKALELDANIKMWSFIV